MEILRAREKPAHEQAFILYVCTEQVLIFEQWLDTSRLCFRVDFKHNHAISNPAIASLYTDSLSLSFSQNDMIFLCYLRFHSSWIDFLLCSGFAMVDLPEEKNRQMTFQILLSSMLNYIRQWWFLFWFCFTTHILHWTSSSNLRQQQNCHKKTVTKMYSKSDISFSYHEPHWPNKVQHYYMVRSI